MAQVVFGEQQPMIEIVSTSGILFQLAAKQILLEKFLPEPDRDRHLKRPKPSRRERYVSFQKALELEKRFVIKHDVVELVETDALLGQAILDRACRKRRVVLFAAEALFLSRSDDLAVPNQGCRAVVIIGGNTENSHDQTGPLKKRIDERRDRAYLPKQQENSH
jgi:hypothetical protein